MLPMVDSRNVKSQISALEQAKPSTVVFDGFRVLYHEIGKDGNITLPTHLQLTFQRTLNSPTIMTRQCCCFLKARL
jgi:hypothetical protein